MSGRDRHLVEYKTGRLSDEELAEIERLAEQNFTAGRISQLIRRHPGTVNYAMHRLCLRVLTKRTFCYERGGKIVKSFSDVEDAFLEQLRVDGKTTAEIAKRLTERFGHPRSPHTVNIRLQLLANAPDDEDLAA